MKTVTVLGARPQFIKAAVVSRSMALFNGGQEEKIEEIIVHTGQHYDLNMSAVFFEEMGIPDPDYNLAISGCSHGAMTGRMLEQIEAVLLKERPDIVLVYGDTNSTLAGALAAVKLSITVAHVEAGLRSFNMKMPEEINRVLTDRSSGLLFCPTTAAVENLGREGIGQYSGLLPRPPIIINVGDVMYDAALFYRKIATPTRSVKGLVRELDAFYLATVHRSENTDNGDRLRNIFEALVMIAKSTPIVLPLHPRTRKAVDRCGIDLGGVRVVDPVGYFDMITLLENCKGVFTDSGGLQKEAYFFQKPCITLRDETEWVELVEHGFNDVVGAEKDKIIDAERRINGEKRLCSVSLYGQGNAGQKIVQELVNYGRTRI